MSALFVTPYPPGFPVLVPGQVISAEILDYVAALDVKEIHGYRPAIGFCVFSEAALELAAASGRPRTAASAPGADRRPDPGGPLDCSQYRRQLVGCTTSVIGTDWRPVPSEAQSDEVKAPTAAPAGKVTAT